MFRKKDVIVERESLDNVNFTNKRNPVEGILSLVIGIVSLLVFLTLGITATIMDGNGQAWIGFAGCLAGIGNVLALFLAMVALKKEDAYYRIPTIGAIINGFAAIGYVMVYIWGLLL